MQLKFPTCSNTIACWCWCWCWCWCNNIYWSAPTSFGLANVIFWRDHLLFWILSAGHHHLLGSIVHVAEKVGGNHQICLAAFHSEPHFAVLWEETMQPTLFMQNYCTRAPMQCTSAMYQWTSVPRYCVINFSNTSVQPGYIICLLWVKALSDH